MRNFFFILKSLCGGKSANTPPSEFSYASHGIIPAFLKPLAFILLFLVVGVGQAWGDIANPYTTTIDEKKWASSNASISLDGVSWKLTTNGTYFGYDATKGQQISTSVTSVALETSDIHGTINSVKINTSGAKNTEATVSVSVGGVTYTPASSTLTSTAKDYTFTGSSTGKIVISWSQSVVKAVYFKSITVNYTGESCSVNPTIGASSSSDICVTGATMSCAGITKGDCDIDEWGFFYKTSAGVTSSDAKIQISSGKSTTNVSSFNSTQSELKPNTHYYFKPYAKVGSEYVLGTEADFTTKNLTSSSSNTTYGTVSRNGRVITGSLKAGGCYGNPAYTVSGGSTGSTTEVVKEGNTFTVTSNSTSNITVTINFEDKGCTDHNGNNVISGSSTSYTYGPVNPYYEYSTRQILYTKTDLGLADGKKGTIKSLYFEYANSSAMTGTNSVKIYMANTDLSALSNSNYETSFTEVYSGALNCSNGWNEVMLTTPFEYNGAGNLVVVIDDNSNKDEGYSAVFKYHTANTTTGAQLYTQSSSTNAAPTTASTWTEATETNNRPNTKFCIQEADMEPYTVYWHVSGSVMHSQTGYAGATLTDIPEPTTNDCDGEKVFVGWTTTANYSDASEAPDFVSPTTIPDGGADYYAVFANTSTSNDYIQVTSESALEAGAKYLIVGFKGSTYKALPVDAATSPTIVSPSSSTISDPGTNLIWTLEGSADAWKIKSISNSKYLQINSGSLSFVNSTSSTFSVSVSSNIFTFTSSASGSNKILSYHNTNLVFNAYSSANTIYIYKQKINYTNYATNCCTKLASVSGSVVKTENSATLTWADVTGAESYQYQIQPQGTSSDPNAWVTASSGVVVNSLNNATNYTAYFRALDSNGSHCAEGPESSTNFRTLSVVTTAVSDEMAGTAQVSLNGSDWSSSVAAEDNTTIHIKATVNPNYAFSSWGATSGSVAAQSAETTLSGWSGNTTVTATFGATVKVKLATPTGMSSSAVTATSATISWNAVTSANGYTVVCADATVGDITENEGVCSCTLTYLSAGTEYTWNVKALGNDLTTTDGDACADQHFTTVAKQPTSIEITTAPTKTVYNSGEHFDATGMVVKVIYNNGDTDDAYTGYTLSPNTEAVLSPANTEVIVSATLNDHTETITQPITVNAKLTWKATGAEDVVTYASAGKAVLPGSNPTAPNCLGDFNHFEGWSASQIAVSTTDEPTYVSAETDATEDATYYAVFARMENGGIEDANSILIVNAAAPSSSPYQAADGATWTWNEVVFNGGTAGAGSGMTADGSWIQVELPDDATEAVSYVVTGTSNSWAKAAEASLTSGETELATLTKNSKSYVFTAANKALGTYKLARTEANIWIANITINYKKVGKTPVEWATTCCTSWDAPAISYDVPSGWKNGDDALAVAIASGATHGDVSYASSNTDVLTVAANGTITAVGPGTAKVTATWAGGLDNEVKYCEALSESATITVTGTVTIHFDGNGATSGSMSDQVVTYNVAEALTANAFEKTGYTFYGWADTQEKANAGTHDYTNQQSVAFLANTTLYAVWTINSHAVTLTQPMVEEVAAGTIKANGETSLPAVNYGTTVTLTATENSSDLDGYVFDSWNVEGATLVGNSFTMPDNAVSVSAVYHKYTWNLTGYSVTTEPALSYTDVESFNKNGVVIEGDYKRSDTEATKQITYAGAWTAKLGEDVIAQGYAFKFADNGKHLSFWIGEEKIYDKVIEVTEIPKDQFVVGIWDIAAPAVQTGEYTMSSLSNQTAGEAATCKDHNIFMGWVLAANADDLKDENIIAAGTKTTAANNTYYAVWAKSEMRTTPRIAESESMATGSNVTIDSNIKYATTQGSGTNSPFIRSNGDLRLYKASSGKYGNYITITADNGFYIKSVEISTATTSANIGYRTAAYSAGNMTDGNVTSSKFSISDISTQTFVFANAHTDAVDIRKIKVTYSKEELVNTDYITDCETRYEISFDANGGEGSYESILRKEEKTITLPDGSALSKEHYSFIGWKIDDAGELLPANSEFTVETADVEFYAQWLEDPKGTVYYVGDNISNSSVTRYALQTYNLRKNVTFPANSHLKLLGWKKEGDETLYLPNQLMTMPDPVENITYTVQYMDTLVVPTSLNLNNGEWVLVTDESQLRAGDMIVIAAAESNDAISTTQNTNNRGKVAISKNGNKMTYTTAVAPLFLQKGYVAGQYALYDVANHGYLFAAGANSNNYIRTKSTYDQDGSWEISIDNNVTTIIARGASTHNEMRYNSSNGLFSAYESTSTQARLVIYKWHRVLESGETNLSDIELTDAVIVKNGATLTVDAASSLVDLTVEAGGKVETTNEQLTVINNLTINSEAGKSGQVTNADNVHANNVYMDVTFYKSAATLDATTANQWYMISAPFDVNLNGGFLQTNGTPMVFGTDFDLFEYDGAKRANTGVTGWKRVSGQMKAGTACLIGFNEGQSTTIRLKAANTAIGEATSITLNAYAGDADNQNWNGVANPNLHYISLDKDVQYYDNVARGYNPGSKTGTSYVVGTAFFIQESGEATISNTVNTTLQAPRRAAQSQELEFCVRLAKEDANWANHIYIRASEDASAQYEQGHDMVTWNGTTAKTALLWTENYGMRLAIEEAPLLDNQASYALGLYVPANGTYRIEVANTQTDATLYLTQGGTIIWNLTDGAYEVDLTAGTTSEYGLLLQAGATQIPTGVEEVGASKAAQKVVIDDHVYILRGEKMYDTTGKMVK